MNQKFKVVLIFTLIVLAASHAFAQIQVSVGVAPPPIAVFDIPPCPGDGYIWTPGYYQYGAYGYYWVPGQWVLPPSAGMLWTPGYWAFGGGKYLWHAGYWGPKVGFYGGVNYGGGYFGTGFTGGRWNGNAFHYNTAVLRVDPHAAHNVYEDRTVVHQVNAPNHAFNGKGGIVRQPTREEAEVEHGPHGGPTPAQVSHAQEAHNNHVAAHGGRP